jgi:hypothetical protein
MAETLNSFLDRLDAKEALTPKETKLALRNGLQTGAAKRDRPLEAPGEQAEDDGLDTEGDVEDLYPNLDDDSAREGCDDEVVYEVLA